MARDPKKMNGACWNMKEFFLNFMGNYWFWSAFSSWGISQIIKLFTGVFKERKWTLRAMLFGSGGMPSAHTAAAVGLTTSLVVTHGTESPLPIITGMIAIVIMTDAMAVRLESGRHSRFLNRMVDEGREPEPEDGKRFQTLLGHTFAQVSVGFAIGVASALLLSLVPFPAFTFK